MNETACNLPTVINYFGVDSFFMGLSAVTSFFTVFALPSFCLTYRSFAEGNNEGFQSFVPYLMLLVVLLLNLRDLPFH